MLQVMASMRVGDYLSIPNNQFFLNPCCHKKQQINFQKILLLVPPSQIERGYIERCVCVSLVCPIWGQSDLRVPEDNQRPIQQPLWGWGKLPALPMKRVHLAASEVLKAAPPEGGLPQAQHF